MGNAGHELLRPDARRRRPHGVGVDPEPTRHPPERGFAVLRRADRRAGNHARIPEAGEGVQDQRRAGGRTGCRPTGRRRRPRVAARARRARRACRRDTPEARNRPRRSSPERRHLLHAGRRSRSTKDELGVTPGSALVEAGGHEHAARPRSARRPPPLRDGWQPPRHLVATGTASSTSMVRDPELVGDRVGGARARPGP